jgi:hypothetical protein
MSASVYETQAILHCLKIDGHSPDLPLVDIHKLLLLPSSPTLPPQGHQWTLHTACHQMISRHWRMYCPTVAPLEDVNELRTADSRSLL